MLKGPILVEEVKVSNLTVNVENTDLDSDIEIQSQISESLNINPPDSDDSVEVTVSLASLKGAKKSLFATFDEEKAYRNIDGDFVTGIDLSSAEVQQQKELRAKRFGISVIEDKPKVDLPKLYESFGLSELEVASPESNLRTEAVHLHGVDHMSTEDVFDYFRDFAPGNIEWIDDASCNVVWMDPMTTARALVSLSRPFHNDPDTNDQDEGTTKAGAVLPESPTKPMETDSTESTTVAKTPTTATPADLSSEEPVSTEQTTTGITSIETGITTESSAIEQSTSTVGASTTTETSASFEPSTTDKTSAAQTSATEPTTSETMDVDSDDDDTFDLTISDAEFEDTHIRRPSRSEEETTITTGKENNDEDVFKAPLPVKKIRAPPGVWRLGVACPKARSELFLRYATEDDKKERGAERRSDYYKRFGNPNYNGLVGLISGSRRRRMKARRAREEMEEARLLIEKYKKGLTSSVAEEVASLASGDHGDSLFGGWSRYAPTEQQSVVSDDIKELEKILEETATTKGTSLVTPSTRGTRDVDTFSLSGIESSYQQDQDDTRELRKLIRGKRSSSPGSESTRSTLSSSSKQSTYSQVSTDTHLELADKMSRSTLIPGTKSSVTKASITEGSDSDDTLEGETDDDFLVDDLRELLGTDTASSKMDTTMNTSRTTKGTSDVDIELDSIIDSHTGSRAYRMRMYADEEQTRRREKGPRYESRDQRYGSRDQRATFGRPGERVRPGTDFYRLEREFQERELKDQEQNLQLRRTKQRYYPRSTDYYDSSSAADESSTTQSTRDGSPSRESDSFSLTSEDISLYGTTNTRSESSRRTRTSRSTATKTDSTRSDRKRAHIPSVGQFVQSSKRAAMSTSLTSRTLSSRSGSVSSVVSASSLKRTETPTSSNKSLSASRSGYTSSSYSRSSTPETVDTVTGTTDSESTVASGVARKVPLYSRAELARIKVQVDLTDQDEESSVAAAEEESDDSSSSSSASSDGE